MDTGERLAAYLSGDLDPDERTALEAELDGDPALRARLARLRRSDQALAALRDDVTLPDGFSDRLQQRLAPELDAVLSDELAARRARRGAPRWLLAASAAAAVVAVVAGGIGIVSSGGGDDAGEAAGGGDAGVALDQADDTGMAESMLAPSEGPVIVDRGRTLDRDDLQALADDPDVQAALDAGPVAEDPAAVALDYAATLGLPMDAPAITEDGGEGTETAAPGPPTAATTTSLQVQVRGDVSDEERATVGACLAVLFEDAAAPVVPVYAELAEDTDGTPVVVYAALAPNADGDYARLEVWMVDRETCQPRLFVQSDLD